jgi:hypothetical protein
MAMTLLQIVTQFCERKNLTVPATVIGSSDKQIVQIRALLEEEGIELRSRGAWQGVTFEATHTTLAAEDQGAMTTIAGAGFDYIKNQTIWDRTDNLPVLGPSGAADWQMMKGMDTTSPRYQFRIRGGKLLANPTPTAGHTWAFEFVSKFWIAATGGTAPTKRFFTADTDESWLPDEIVTLGLEWRWKAAKGLDYAENFRSYEAMVKDALGRDGGKPILSMSGEGRCESEDGVLG